MNMVVIANVVSAISLLCAVCGAYSKKRKYLMVFWILENVTCIFTYWLLGSPAGCVILGLEILSAILVLYKVTGRVVQVALPLLMVVSGVLINTEGWVGLLPVVASSGYALVVLLTKGVKAPKITMTFGYVLWCVYAWLELNYVGAATCAFMAVNLAVVLITHKKRGATESEQSI